MGQKRNQGEQPHKGRNPYSTPQNGVGRDCGRGHSHLQECRSSGKDYRHGIWDPQPQRDMAPLFSPALSGKERVRERGKASLFFAFSPSP